MNASVPLLITHSGLSGRRIGGLAAPHSAVELALLRSMFTAEVPIVEGLVAEKLHAALFSPVIVSMARQLLDCLLPGPACASVARR